MTKFGGFLEWAHGAGRSLWTWNKPGSTSTSTSWQPEREKETQTGRKPADQPADGHKERRRWRERAQSPQVRELLGASGVKATFFALLPFNPCGQQCLFTHGLSSLDSRLGLMGLLWEYWDCPRVSGSILTFTYTTTQTYLTHSSLPPYLAVPVLDEDSRGRCWSNATLPPL